LRAETGKDILAPVATRLTMSAQANRLPTTAGVTQVALAEEGVATTIGGTPGTGVTGSTPVLAPTTGGSVLDLRNVLRPREKGVAVGRFTATKVPGSYTIAVTATGFSPSCSSRFVRRDLVSVVVEESG